MQNKSRTKGSNPGARSGNPPTNGSAVKDWAEQFKNATNQDPEIQANGKHYTCNYLLDMQDHCAVVKVYQGQVTDVAVDPGPLDEHYHFAIRASPETWRKFSEKTPEPMYHGLWAASFRKDMKLEGDILVMMQNLRCLTRNLELLRTTGVPVNV